jgi:hypothetical protein
MRRWLLVLVLASGIAAIAYAVLGRSEPRRPRPIAEQEEAPEPSPALPNDPIPTPAATGTLVVRLSLPEGTELPAKAEAGYRRFGQKRLRPIGADGTFRFSDVPVGTLEAIAEVEGYQAEPVTVTLVPGMPAEALILLKATSPPGK